MTEVIYSRIGTDHLLVLRGHAGYAENGTDIVCAGLSAITYTLMGFLKNNEDKASMRDEPGMSIILCPSSNRVDAAFEMAVIGYMQIAKQYPDNVTIHISGTAGGSREQTLQTRPA